MRHRGTAVPSTESSYQVAIQYSIFIPDVSVLSQEVRE